jgi:hypothetical protein
MSKVKKSLVGWVWHDICEYQRFGWVQIFPLRPRDGFEKAVSVKGRKKQFKKVRITIEEL